MRFSKIDFANDMLDAVCDDWPFAKVQCRRPGFVSNAIGPTGGELFLLFGRWISTGGVDVILRSHGALSPSRTLPHSDLVQDPLLFAAHMTGDPKFHLARHRLQVLDSVRRFSRHVYEASGQGP